MLHNSHVCDSPDDGRDPISDGPAAPPLPAAGPAPAMLHDSHVRDSPDDGRDPASDGPVGRVRKRKGKTDL